MDHQISSLENEEKNEGSPFMDWITDYELIYILDLVGKEMRYPLLTGEISRASLYFFFLLSKGYIRDEKSF